jgi:hypothetical protein
MSKHGQRYAGGATAFAFLAVWTTAGGSSAFVCLLAAGLGFGLVSAGQILGGKGASSGAASRRGDSTPTEARRPQPARLSRQPEQQKVDRVSAPMRDEATVVDRASYGW